MPGYLALLCEERCMVCNQENSDMQGSCYLKGYKRSVQIIQGQIYKARAEDKIQEVHALQEQLCESFCAKLLATDYAISSIGYDGTGIRSLPPLLACQKSGQGVEWYQARRSPKLRCTCLGPVPTVLLVNATQLYAGLRSPKDTQHAKCDLRHIKTCAYKKLCTSLRKAVYNRYRQNNKKAKTGTEIPEDWKISIAQSLWMAEDVDNANSVDLDASVNAFAFTESNLLAKRSSCEKAQNNLPLLFSVKVGQGYPALTSVAYIEKQERDQRFSRLHKSVRDKIQKEAEQIHAFLALEPEWQAVFYKKDKREKEPVFTSCKQTPCSWKIRGLSLLGFQKQADYLRKKEWCGTVEACQSLKPCIDACGGKGFTESSRLRLPSFMLGSLDQQPRMKAHTTSCTCEIDRPDSIVKRIKTHLESSLAKSFFTVSMRGCLHTMDHQLLIRELNTFKAMETRIKTWLRVYAIARKAINPQSGFRERHKGELGKHKPAENWVAFNEIRRYTHYPNNWRLSMSPQPCIQKLGFVNPSLRKAELPWLPSRYSLYSCFPQALWKEQDLTYDITQIEDHSDIQGHALTGLFLRIVHNLLEQSIRQRVKGCIKRKVQDLLCVGHLGDYIVIHPDKKLLEICVLQVKRYLSGTSLRMPEQGAQNDSLGERKLAESWVPYTENSLGGSMHVPPTVFSRIRDCREGFTWLGFQFIQVASQNLYVCKVTPSQGSIRDLLLVIKARIKQSQSASTINWVSRLNPVICRWVEYYRHCEYKRSYHKICYSIWEKTRPWLSRRKAKKS